MRSISLSRIVSLAVIPITALAVATAQPVLADEVLGDQVVTDSIVPDEVVTEGVVADLALEDASLSAGSPKPGAWTPLAPVATGATEGMSTADVGIQIVAAYGFSGGDTNLTRLYNIALDVWTQGTDGPLPRRSEGIGVSHGGNFYTLGGRDDGPGAPPIGNNDRYMPATDTWVSLTPMPTPRAGLGAAVVGNAIYAIGGRPGTAGICSGGAFASNERYDIDTDTWSAAAPLPTPRSDVGVISHGGKVYVFGGCAEDGTKSNQVDIYDPVTDSWSSGALMPTPRAGFYGIGIVGSSIYVMGGENVAGTPAPENEVYNVPADTWSADTPMIDPRGEMGVVSHGGRIYTVGGAYPDQGFSSASNHAFKP